MMFLSDGYRDFYNGSSLIAKFSLNVPLKFWLGLHDLENVPSLVACFLGSMAQSNTGSVREFYFKLWLLDRAVASWFVYSE
jgi:hypothetical protein